GCGRGRLPGQAVRPRRAGGASARAAAPRGGTRGAEDRVWRAGARSGHTRSTACRFADRAFAARIRFARCADGAARSDPVARPTRGQAVWMERIGGKQHRRGTYPFAAQEARRRCHSQRARRRLDDRQARQDDRTGPMKSIRRQLLVWLLGGLALAIIAAAFGTYFRAREEANSLFDYQLKEMAASLTDAPFAPAPAGVGALGPGSNALLVQIWDRNGVQLYLSQPHRVLPQNAQLGFTTVDTKSGAWRVFSTLADGQVVQVAQPMSARHELATSMALRTVVPLLLALPVLALLIWLTIARGLAPLDRVASAVARRSPALLEPLSESALPREVQPLVGALNGLLGRLSQALAAQRSFIADAAHELRTPLTAVHL